MIERNRLRLPLIPCFEGNLRPDLLSQPINASLLAALNFYLKTVLEFGSSYLWHWGEYGVDSDPRFELSARHQVLELVQEEMMLLRIDRIDTLDWTFFGGTIQVLIPRHFAKSPTRYRKVSAAIGGKRAGQSSVSAFTKWS